MFVARELKQPVWLRFSILLLAFITLFGSATAQTRVAGGEITYKFLRQIVTDIGTFNSYEVTVRVFRECQEKSSLPPSVDIVTYNELPQNMTPRYLPGEKVTGVLLSGFYSVYQIPNECSKDLSIPCSEVGVYTTVIDLPVALGSWILYVQDYYRKWESFVNVSTDGIGKFAPTDPFDDRDPPHTMMGYTFQSSVHGGLDLNNNPPLPSSSPVFKKEFPIILCTGQPFRYDFSATDADADSLSYSFSRALQGYIWVRPRYPSTPDSPPFLSLDYNAPYSPSQPMGANVRIDPVTGIISGTAPARAGRYLTVVTVKKYRNGELVGSINKETQFIFQNCTGPNAQLDDEYKNCNGLSVKFFNYSTGNIKSYSWDFGDLSTNRDTSSQAEPVYTYPAPGVYTVKLFLNKGTTFCKDSAISKVVVDTGLNASFSVRRSLDVCNEALYDFTNSSTPGSSSIISNAWDFGEITTNTDVSSLLHPSYTYPTDGSKVVRLIIKNSIGCSDTAFKTINAFKSLMQAPNDTTICYLDTIPLITNTNGYPGTFSWSPNYRISSLTAPSPLVNPQKDTTYYITFTDTTGCVAFDSVRVSVRDSVKISINNFDTTICKLDTLHLSVKHDGLSVTWQPSSDITPTNPSGSNADAILMNTGMIIATSHFGSCFEKDTMNVVVVPRPQPTINNDTSVCLGAPVYLHATGGAFYLWSPAATLDNPVSPNPIAHPDRDIIYSVSVFDTLGCPKHTIASVTVTTFRGLFAHAEKDTMLVEGEPVQLRGSGGQYYQWSPAGFLSNPSIPNPVARTYGDVTYTMKITNDDHCVDSAKVRIRAFKDPDIYVPTAFTPNNDGKNDLFKVFPVGFTLQELKIYDRWGNVLFFTSDYTKGWDGKYKGETLATGTFVWTASGTNIKTSKRVYKKGVVTLIR